MIRHIDAPGVIDAGSEIHYRFHRRTDPSEYPQVHDFFELTLMVEGTMRVQACGRGRTLARGALMLLRPGDVHSRFSGEGCAYINLAFPSHTVQSLFEFLGLPECLGALLALPDAPCVQLPSGETTLLQARLQQLSRFSPSQAHRTRAELRRLLLDVFHEWFVPLVQTDTAPEGWPAWFQDLLRFLDDPEHLGMNLEELAQTTGRSREHICRTFRRCLNTTPQAYLNGKRLECARSLLLHTDLTILEVCYGSGFQSVSRFYHAFREMYGTAPMRLRRAPHPPQTGA